MPILNILLRHLLSLAGENIPPSAEFFPAIPVFPNGSKLTAIYPPGSVGLLGQLPALIPPTYGGRNGLVLRRGNPQETTWVVSYGGWYPMVSYGIP